MAALLRVTLEEDRKMAVLRIADEGTGIPPEIREKIFDLYFTTKSGGSGIGLAMTYRILQLHHGSVDVQSKGRPWHGILTAHSTRRHGMGTPASATGHCGRDKGVGDMKLSARSAAWLCCHCC